MSISFILRVDSCIPKNIIFEIYKVADDCRTQSLNTTMARHFSIGIEP